MRLKKIKRNKIKLRKIISIIIGVILLLSIYLNTYLLIKYNILPMKYLIIYFLLICLIPFTLIYLTIFRRLKNYLRRIFLGIEILYMIILFIVFFYLNQTFNFLDNFTSNFDYETKTYYVLTDNNSNYNKVDELNNKDIGYTNSLDRSVDNALKQLDKKIKLSHKEYDGITTLLDDLYGNNISSILMLDSFYNMLQEDENSNIASKTKIIYKFSIREKIENIEKDVDVTKETFNVYVSGIDTYGSVTEQTRSDVNIVMSINPKTHKILMINIPRDYYVTLANSKKEDKLTHAGIYGVQNSVKTIENLLDIDINYYVKVNYNALIDLVDALDGVSVYSKYTFRSYEYNYLFKEGYNDVNGKMALDFVRTRKAFLDGDRVRGENQQAMIEAIIKKANNASILLKYDDILKSLDGSFTTNISTNKIMNLVNAQLDKMPSWNISSISLNGSDSYNYTYTYPNQELYVMVPDEETINYAKEMLENNM